MTRLNKGLDVLYFYLLSLATHCQSPSNFLRPPLPPSPPSLSSPSTFPHLLGGPAPWALTHLLASTARTHTQPPWSAELVDRVLPPERPCVQPWRLSFPLTPWVQSFAKCFLCLSCPWAQLLSEDGNRNFLWSYSIFYSWWTTKS